MNLSILGIKVISCYVLKWLPTSACMSHLPAGRQVAYTRCCE